MSKTKTITAADLSKLMADVVEHGFTPNFDLYISDDTMKMLRRAFWQRANLVLRLSRARMRRMAHPERRERRRVWALHNRRYIEKGEDEE